MSRCFTSLSLPPLSLASSSIIFSAFASLLSSGHMIFGFQPHDNDIDFHTIFIRHFFSLSFARDALG